ncbi:MAG: hypothetical protein LQ351_003367 [Letrouitia transgressa]|nr:MAG: hypothetical protein LQ351_003367 [Letrouitia transgressa]
MHLNGLLALLNSPLYFREIKENSASTDLFSVSSPLGTATVEASSLLNAEAVNLVYGLQSRLYKLAPELDSTFHNGTGPRKLDVQKIRVALKGLHKDLCVAHRMLEGKQWRHRLDRPSMSHWPLQSLSAVASRAQRYAETDHGLDGECLQQQVPDHSVILKPAHANVILNNLRTAMIVSAAFLLESGGYLDSKSSWPSTKEFRTLNSTIQDAVNGIWTSAACSSNIIISETPGSKGTETPSFKILDGLLLMWPLYAALRAPGISELQHLLFEQALRTVGEVGRIPKAIALVRHHALLNDLVE